MVQSPLQRAIDSIGSQAALAEAIGTKQQNISYWLTKGEGKIPPEYVPVASDKTGIPRHELRPDLPALFPPPTEQAA